MQHPFRLALSCVAISTGFFTMSCAKPESGPEARSLSERSGRPPASDSSQASPESSGAPTLPTPSSSASAVPEVATLGEELQYCPGASPSPPGKKSVEHDALDSIKELNLSTLSRLSSAQPTGTVDESVSVAVADVAKRSRHCYQVELQKNAELAGRIKLRVKFHKAGQVESVCTLHNTMGNEEVPRCIARKLAALKLPALAADTTVELPFVFQTQ